MNCKNCGSPLVSGQVICSNCDTENIVDNNEQNKAYNDVNQNMINTSINNFNMINDNTNYNNQTNSTYNNYESGFVEEKPKKEKNIVLIIVIAVIFVPMILIGLLALVFVIATSSINSTLENARNNQLVEEYKIIKKTIQTYYSSGGEVVCDDNCSLLFDLDEDLYELEVYDEGSYFKIELESTNDSLNLTADDCKNIDNTVCTGNEIIGRIYK